MNIKEKLWLNIEKIVFAVIVLIWMALIYSIVTEVVTEDDIAQYNEMAVNVQQNLTKPISLGKSPDMQAVAAERLSPLAPQKEIVPGMAYQVYDPKPLTYTECAPDLHNWDLVSGDVCLRCHATKEIKMEPAVISLFNTYAQSTGMKINAQRVQGVKNPAALLGMWVFLKKHGDEWPDKVKKFIDDSKTSKEPGLSVENELCLLSTPSGKRFEAVGDVAEAIIDALEPESQYDVFIVLESQYVPRNRAGSDPDKKWFSLPSEIKNITTLRQSQLLVFALRNNPLQIKCRAGKFVDKDWLYADIEVIARGEKDYRDKVSDGRMRQKVEFGDTVYDFDIQRFFIGKAPSFVKEEKIDKKEIKNDSGDSKIEVTDRSTFRDSAEVVIVEERTGIEKHEPLNEFRHFESELKKLYIEINDFIPAHLVTKEGKPNDTATIYPVNTNIPKINETNRLKRLKRMGFGIKIKEVPDDGFYIDEKSRDDLLDLAGKYMSMDSKRINTGHYPRNDETNKILRYMEQVRAFGEKNNWAPPRPVEPKAPAAPAAPGNRPKI